MGPESNGGPSLSFSDTKIVATGARSGETLYAAGMEVRGGQYGVGVETHVATTTVSADGTGQLDMQRRITVRSIWIVVDGKGGYTVSPGPHMARHPMNLPGAGAVTGSDGQVKHLLFKRYSVVVFLIRPGAGMWSTRLLDGRINDDDGKMDGSVSGSLSNLVPVAGTTAPPPDHLLPGDVLFSIDPYGLDYAVARQGN